MSRERETGSRSLHRKIKLSEQWDRRTAYVLLTVADVAQLLKISASSVRRLQSDGKISFVKVRGSVRFARADIVSYIAKCRVEAIGS